MTAAHPVVDVMRAPPKRGKRARSLADANLPTWAIGATAPTPKGPYIALVPGEDAPLMRFSMPSALIGTPRLRVAQRQLQDQIGPDARMMELRPTTLVPSQAAWSAAVVVASAQVRAWRAGVATVGGGQCRAILPDYLALPVAARVWTVWTEHGGRVQARLDLGDGFAAEGDLAALALERAFDAEALTPTGDSPASASARSDLQGPRVILCLGRTSEAIAQVLEQLPAEIIRIHLPQSDPDTLPDPIPGWPSGVARPERFANGELGLDLASDPDSGTKDLANRLRALRWPLGLALLGGVAWCVATYMETRALTEAREVTEDRVTAAVRRDFLGNAPLLDVRAQVTRELDARRAGVVPTASEPVPGLQVLRRATQVLAEADAHARMISLDLQGMVTLDLVLPDFAALEAIGMALAAQGLEVAQGPSGTGQEGQVEGQLIVSALPPATGEQPQ